MGTETYLIAAIGALASVVTVLWRVDIANRNKEQAELRASLADAIIRIQALEESRLSAAIHRGDEMKALAEKFVRELSYNSGVLKDLKEAFETFSKALTVRPCMHEFEPTTLSIRPTETIVESK